MRYLKKINVTLLWIFQKTLSRSSAMVVSSTHIFFEKEHTLFFIKVSNKWETITLNSSLLFSIGSFKFINLKLTFSILCYQCMKWTLKSLVRAYVKPCLCENLIGWIISGSGFCHFNVRILNLFTLLKIIYTNLFTL